MEFRGAWLAIEADDDVRRHGIGFDADVTDWHIVAVPGHWQDHPKFATSNGPVMYRHTFTAEPPPEGRRRWVTLDGIFYQGDVWLDGAYLGDPEGYFFPHSFDISALSRLGTEHVLAVEVTCAPQLDTQGRRNLTGTFQSSIDSVVATDGEVSTDGAAHRNPGGLWRRVTTHDTGPVRIDRLRVLCRDADERRAHLRLAARLDSDRQLAVTVRTLLDGAVHEEQEQVVAVGENELEWSFDVTDPNLWWPRSLGDQPLTEVAVEVIVDGPDGPTRSDRRQRRTGLRQITWDNWVCSVNGEQLFLKGANLAPTAAFPANADAQAVRADIDAALELGLDAVRVHGHIADRPLYDAADEHGLLLLQDFPLQWGYARGVRGQAVEQARAAVDSLGHHPSIALWNAHNDPAASSAIADDASWRTRIRSATAQQLPSWNRSVLDRWVKRALERADPSREVIAHSGVLPHLPQLDGTDSHLRFGWRRGGATDLAEFAARVPRLVRFVSEFGSDSAPTTAPFIDDQLATHEWPDLDWRTIAATNGYDEATFSKLFPPADYDSYHEWSSATQHYQSHVLKVQIETLRRLKYRPSGGFCFSTLVDSAPAISSSVLDHARVPKAAFETVREACAAVLVVAEQPPDLVDVGDRISVDVHLINDLRDPIDFAVVDAVASWAGGEQRWRFGGEVLADDVVKVGRIRFDAPDVVGTLRIDLTMTAGAISSHNAYTTQVISPA